MRIRTLNSKFWGQIEVVSRGFPSEKRVQIQTDLAVGGKISMGFLEFSVSSNFEKLKSIGYWKCLELCNRPGDPF